MRSCSSCGARASIELRHLPSLRGLEQLGDLLAGPEQMRCQRRLAHLQRTRGLAVGQAEHVHRDQRKAEVVWQRGDRRVHLLHLERPLGSIRRPRVGCNHVFERRSRHRPARGGAQAGEACASAVLRA